jgi:hypothetical protein
VEQVPYETQKITRIKALDSVRSTPRIPANEFIPAKEMAYLNNSNDTKPSQKVTEFRSRMHAKNTESSI